MTRRTAQALVPPFAVLLLAVLGCGGLGLPGTGSPPPPRPAEDVVTGEVAAVDTAAREIELDDRGRRQVVRYDGDTRVVYEGRDYRPEDLEPGDVVRIRVDGLGTGRLYAEQVDVVESVQARRDRPYDDPADDRYGDLSGEIERVDPARREIRIATSAGVRVVEYESRTPVYYQGETYQPENLEPGDEVRVKLAERGGGTLAESIEVTRSVQERGGYEDDRGERYGADRIEGTVEWVDERKGEFGLRTEARELLTVAVPFDAEAPIRDRFAALERGDYVRIEAEGVERGRVELVRFR